MSYLECFLIGLVVGVVIVSFMWAIFVPNSKNEPMNSKMTPLYVIDISQKSYKYTSKPIKIYKWVFIVSNKHRSKIFYKSN